MNPIEQFRCAMTARAILPPADIIADGKIHRCDADGKNGRDDAAYLLHLDGIAAGGFENHRDGLGWENWREEGAQALTPAQEQARKARINAQRLEMEQAKAHALADAKARATAIWDGSARTVSEHTYLTAKGVASHKLRVCKDELRIAGMDCKDALVVPMRNSDGEVCQLQFITTTDKRFLNGPKPDGLYFSIGTPSDIVCLTEGYATGASVHEATGHAVAVAFTCRNLEPVARAIRAKLPDARIVVCADDDYRTDGNPGVAHATAAARAVGGALALPHFGADRPDGATDFNDLARACGHEAVAAAVAHAVTQDDAVGVVDSAQWPEPQSLTESFEPEPYPLDALPAIIRNAVEEVQRFVKAPIPLVASSALAAVSIAVQAHADVQRTEGLSGPVSLFLLSIADSGERKSTCDKFFTESIRKYEAEQAENAKPEIARYCAALKAWEAKRAGLADAIKQAAKRGSTKDLEAKLMDLEEQKPIAPRVPRLTYGDATPEAQAWSLANHWPSGGVLSNEAGAIFGSHAMNAESQMRNLSILNVLWDGNPQSFDRRKEGGSFKVEGARFTVALQVQEPTLRAFFERSGDLARGSGFLARFLVAWPESTQGSRAFSEAPKEWPSLSAFRNRIADILAKRAPVNERGGLSPALLTMTPPAKAAWVEYHDAVETELRSGGDLSDVRDVASKSADNAARLAALFSVFAHGIAEQIDADALDGASRIAAWHLSESRRFFGELAMSPDLANASRLDAWLTAYCRRLGVDRIARRELQRHVSPTRLRQTAALTRALHDLEEAGRIRVVSEGKRKDILVNPALLSGNAS